mgnify:CR=1 FL=1
MRYLNLIVVMLVYGGVAAAESPDKITKWIDGQMESLVKSYQWFHTHPELSFQEEQTAKRVADHFRKDGFEVTEAVGGHGVVGVLKNGDGPVLMLRCDLDALPVTEQTSLPYASTKKVELPGGTTAGVMHACGHDLHMTNLIATARCLSQHRNHWAGTCLLYTSDAADES